MAVEEFFSDAFIHQLRLYLYNEFEEDDVDIIYEIASTDPNVIRRLLKRSFWGSRIPEIMVENGNYEGSRSLLLSHNWTGFELDERYNSGVLRHIYRLWGRPVFLKTFKDDNEIIVSTEDGKKIVTVDA